MTRFPRLYLDLTGVMALPLADPLEPLRLSLAEQVKRGGRGSDIAAAKLEGIRCAELRRVS